MSLLAQSFSDPQTYMPHGMCYLWQPGLLWLHVVADILTGAAYFAIPPSLLFLVVRARREVPEGATYAMRRLPHEWMYIAFGLFIVACGSTHFFAAWNVWHASYWAAGGAKAITAVASVGTALALPPLIPRALRLVREARTSDVRRLKLEEANAELERLNAQLSEMDRWRTELFANVSHELRTPLALILGPVSVRLTDETLGEATRADLLTVRRNARLLQKRVDDLLDVARAETGAERVNVEAVDASDVVRATVARFEGAAPILGLTLEAHAPDELPAALDGVKFERIVDNLLANAMKFTPEGGTVRVVLALEERSLVLRVDDDGPGVAPEEREVIFERFRQLDSSSRRERGGAGLGLALVRDFARLMGGDATVGDSPSGGARFIVRVPYRPTWHAPRAGWISSPTVAAEMAGAEALPPRGPHVEPGSAPRVLVVEDDAQLRHFTRSVLESEFDCAAADSGESALTLLDRWTPEVAVIDIMMPGMDGVELLRRIRALPDTREAPVLVLSALAETDMRARMLREGADDYVTKPFSPEELRARVARLIKAKRARDVLRLELTSASDDIDQMAAELARRRKALALALDEVTAARDRASAANEAKTNFLAVMSHELRTPLNGIVGYSDLLDLGIEGPLTDRQKRHLDRIREGARHLLSTIEDILLFARSEPHARPAFRRPTRLGDFLNEVVAMVRPEAGQKGLTLEVDSDDAEILVDRDQLRHVLTNLVVNAVKFTPAGQVRVNALVDGGRLSVVVEDTGPGIPAEDHERIFEPFWQGDQTSTRTQGGTGLGLSIARRVAQQLGGEIEVDAAPGRGSRFTFQMPIEEADRAA